MLKKFLPRLSV